MSTTTTTTTAFVDPVLTAFLKATDPHFTEERMRRVKVSMAIRGALLEACRAKTEDGGVVPLQTIAVELPIHYNDCDHFKEVATQIRQHLDFPDDDRVLLTASVTNRQKCDSKCEVDYGDCGCPRTNYLRVALKRLKE
jgi:hypothetical protein